MRKLAVMIILAFISLSLVLTGCASKSNSQGSQNPVDEEVGGQETFKVGLVADIGGINDQSFNQSAWEGMKELENELGYEVKYLESEQETDFGSNLDRLSDEDLDMIWGVGFLMADAMKNAAEINPDQKYGIVDSAYEEQPDNLGSYLFKAQESTFLVGYIAGKMTKTDHVGFVGPIRNPIIDQFEYGFRGGVAYAAKELGKEIRVDVQYCESFDDDAKAKAIATVMYSEGADIIFASAGGAGIGAIEAAKEMDKYVIGVDRDQNYLAPDHVITSAIKNVDKIIFKVTQEIAEGTFNGGTATTYGLEDGAVGIAPTSDKHVPADVLQAVEKVKEEIIEGTITAPLNDETLQEFIAGLQ